MSTPAVEQPSSTRGESARTDAPHSGDADTEGFRGLALPLGAHARADGSTSFLIWSPASAGLSLQLTESGRTIELERAPAGYHFAIVSDVAPGTRYRFILPDGSALPDPASRFQPDGVHGPSEVLASDFDWQTPMWDAPDLRDYVIYEMHVGTFTPEGTFDAAAARLRELRDLGVTAVELMPIAQFPGSRNWGYDGVFPFAAQSTYGGPIALKRFVDAAHGLDMAVVLDVVYNHLGPEGNCLSAYGPYFTDVYHTAWGAALNFDGAGSDEVRRYFIDSALQWVDEFRIDAFRLDAIHAIHDRSAQPFLRELATAVHERAGSLGRTAVLIAESDLGDPRVLRTERMGGLGFDAQWLDDFHHSLRTLLTGEDTGYYTDFGSLDHFARACQHGFVYTGQHSRFRNRRHGAPADDILPRQLVVYAQNHDQVGNRLTGDRLSAVASPAQLRLAAAAVLLSPFTPLLFMGEEWGSESPFPYFVSHSDPELVEAVRCGRKEEFATFSWEGDPPDPQAEGVFRSAILDWDTRTRDGHSQLRDLYRDLLRLRTSAAGIRSADSIGTEILDLHGKPADGSGRNGVVVISRRAAEQSSILLLNFSGRHAAFTVPAAQRHWRCALQTEAGRYGGRGSLLPDLLPGNQVIELQPHSAALLLHDEL